MCDVVVLALPSIRRFSRRVGYLGGHVCGNRYGRVPRVPDGKGGEPTMKSRVWLPLMIAILVFLTGSAQAATITFTSTADFDAGTKGPTVNGNLGIETITDNPGMAANAFELGNLKGDAYT